MNGRKQRYEQTRPPPICMMILLITGPRENSFCFLTQAHSPSSHFVAVIFSPRSPQALKPTSHQSEIFPGIFDKFQSLGATPVICTASRIPFRVRSPARGTPRHTCTHAPSLTPSHPAKKDEGLLRRLWLGRIPPAGLTTRATPGPNPWLILPQFPIFLTCRRSNLPFIPRVLPSPKDSQNYKILSVLALSFSSKSVFVYHFGSGLERLKAWGD
jgi:hypothetical protein